MKILKGRNCSMPSMQQRKVKPLKGVVYLPKSENIVAVKLASSLYKLSLQTRETQDLLKDWKDGIIVPVFKKGRRKDCGNYRGISLLSIAEKILTRILLNRLNEHIVPISCLRLDVVFAVHGRGTVDMIDPLFCDSYKRSVKSIICCCMPFLLTSLRLFIQCSESIDVLLNLSIWRGHCTT